MVSNIIVNIKFFCFYTFHKKNIHRYRRHKIYGRGQAPDLRVLPNGKGVTTAEDVIRKYVDFLDVYRPLHGDYT